MLWDCYNDRGTILNSPGSSKKPTPLGLSASTPTLVCRRTDARRAFAGGRNIAEFRMTHKASVVIGVVLERNLHCVAAAFKAQLESFVGHWIVSCLHACSRSLQSRQWRVQGTASKRAREIGFRQVSQVPNVPCLIRARASRLLGRAAGRFDASGSEVPLQHPH
jgi:hypothetical protein